VISSVTAAIDAAASATITTHRKTACSEMRIVRAAPGSR
jgi:hypothetical protein